MAMTSTIASPIATTSTGKEVTAASLAAAGDRGQRRLRGAARP
jgi:hypothetical protein